MRTQDLYDFCQNNFSVLYLPVIAVLSEHVSVSMWSSSDGIIIISPVFLSTSLASSVSEEVRFSSSW